MSDFAFTAEQIRTTLLAVRERATWQQLLMLQHQYRQPNHAATMTAMARAVGHDTFHFANSQYGTLARWVAEKLGYDPPEDRWGKWWRTLSVGPIPETGEPILTMRPEVAAALRDLGCV